MKEIPERYIPLFRNSRTPRSDKEFEKLKKDELVVRHLDGWILKSRLNKRGAVVCQKTGHVIGWRGKFW